MIVSSASCLIYVLFSTDSAVSDMSSYASFTWLVLLVFTADWPGGRLELQCPVHVGKLCTYIYTMDAQTYAS